MHLVSLSCLYVASFSSVYYGENEIFRSKVIHAFVSCFAFNAVHTHTRAHAHQARYQRHCGHIEKDWWIDGAHTHTQVVSKTLCPDWEQSAEFTIGDLNRVKLTMRLFDMDADH